MNKIQSKPTLCHLNQDQTKALETGRLADYLKPEQIGMLVHQCKAFSFSKGQCIVRQGKPAEGVFIIVEGKVDIVARILGEGNTKIETLEHSGIIGGISFIEKGPSPTSAIAVTPVVCLFISSGFFDFLNAIDPDAKYKITKAINKQLCRSMKRTHDRAVKFITKSPMVSLSFIGRALQSVTEPTAFSPKDEDDPDIKAVLLNPLFYNFTNEEKSELLEHSYFIKAPKNCILIHEGEKKSSCFVVLHGAVQSSIMQNNKLAKLSVIGPGSLFAGVACIDKKSNFTISFITCESSVLFKLSEEHLNYFKQDKPIIWYKLFNLISQSLVALGKSINKLDVRLHIETYNR
ncbi:Crp/Fnr family transcriptional regulator [Legionella impletisoli]|uniref:cNMP-binding domain-containing protein n=1 Tax=Legionella impletisoli TaxID=343510 RepID=A0A917JPJ3_9GAMM|nr:cyclic nucleotide-binding domain-containing protein [Legionella impletisoli]GGI76562.1 cNMP-binding domain-containing protein [Legionella impletisoli]